MYIHGNLIDSVCVCVCVCARARVLMVYKMCIIIIWYYWDNIYMYMYYTYMCTQRIGKVAYIYSYTFNRWSKLHVHVYTSKNNIKQRLDTYHYLQIEPKKKLILENWFTWWMNEWMKKKANEGMITIVFRVSALPQNCDGGQIHSPSALRQ